MADNWDSNNIPWEVTTPDSGSKLPVFAVLDLFYQAENETLIAEETGTTNFLLERVGLPLTDRLVNTSVRKLITGVFLNIEGFSGDTVLVYLGAQPETANDSPLYLPARTYTIGTDTYLDGEIEGRFACIKLEATGNNPMTVVSFEVEFQASGLYC